MREALRDRGSTETHVLMQGPALTSQGRTPVLTALLGTNGKQACRGKAALTSKE